MVLRNLSPVLFLILTQLLPLDSIAQDTWPPSLPTANNKGVASLSSPELLIVPASVQGILDSNSDARLQVATSVPKVELVYHYDLPNAALNGTGWSSWGDICLASDGRVYSGIGNHWKTEKGESYIYQWDPRQSNFKKIVDLNKASGAKPGEVRFSKVHAHIIEGIDKKIYFTGTLDNGSLGGSEQMLGKWSQNIAGGKLFQYDPKTGKTVVYADFPPTLVTATMKYDPAKNILYAELEGHPKGASLGAFDMSRKEWIYRSEPGTVTHHRDMMLDNSGNIYFNGQLEPVSANSRGKDPEGGTSMLPAEQVNRIKNLPLTQVWKYNPDSRSISATKSKTYGGIRSSTQESKEGYIYGTTMDRKLFRYSPSKDEMTMLGSNFLAAGEYITVCDLSPDEKYLYYLPGAHGSAGFSGTPVIQYTIATGQQKAIAFLSEAMTRAWNYAPGGTYGLKISQDGSRLYVGLNGSPPDHLRPKGIARGFGLTSFAVIHIPAEER